MKNYFNTAENFAMNSYSNYGGDWNNIVEQPYNYADGGASQGAAKSSLPFTFNIANSTTDDVTGVVLLGANKNTYGASNFGNVAAITITMSTGTVTYTQFLENTKAGSFKVGMMYLQSSNTSQPFENITINYQDVNGVSSSIPVSPMVDPMQNQAGVTIIREQFIVDGNTEITTTILASATLKLKMFPAEQIDLARDLAGRGVIKGYSAPNVSQMSLPRG